ncbi:MAG TPA: ankyrin repeat domain-containing protein [Actinophytocola sp.]|uniref:ankyrin repeat domain-containing protein n=1 Tax=Actinophytocola sp. TaxID=1872138 RepID=UPI002DDD95A3|nr:ankyrin repeat domain-containing protein [Actinophytocola sp.]HEV2779634.1 ankyrin repeat domain-containing protein [Actinophytocola sp.]
MPPATDVEKLRKRAKDLLRDLRAGRPAALDRLAAHHPNPPAPPRLADAQLVIAREHGFPSWPKLHAYARRVAAHGPTLRHAFEENVDYYADRADGLLASATDGTADAVAAFARWDAPLTRRGARTVVASDHGFDTWAALCEHVEGLAAGGEPFHRAWRAIRAQDPDALAARLDRFPELVAAQGTNGNDLLGLAAGTRDERLVALLVERGADVARGNVHGWTALHQAGYCGLPHMARVLLEAGAPVDVSARGDGGTPMIIALFWGHRDVARQLAEHGVAPRNLRAAAGLDDVDLIDELLSATGRPTPAAGAHRAFYRPHGGFPAWRPSADPREVVDEALSWAARNGSVRAIERLHARGADLDADVYRGTPLAWAAARGEAEAVRRLLALGADPDRRGTFGGPTHGRGVTALHLAAQDGHVEVIRVLLDAGADPAVRDEVYDSAPSGWADHFGHSDAVELLAAR